MEFLRVVEEELRGLAAEARRRHPVVQEAAERCVNLLSPPARSRPPPPPLPLSVEC